MNQGPDPVMTGVPKSAPPQEPAVTVVYPAAVLVRLGAVQPAGIVSLIDDPLLKSWLSLFVKTKMN
jgi:hypothetical protein